MRVHLLPDGRWVPVESRLSAVPQRSGQTLVSQSDTARDLAGVIWIVVVRLLCELDDEEFNRTMRAIRKSRRDYRKERS